MTALESRGADLPHGFLSMLALLGAADGPCEELATEIVRLVETARRRRAFRR